jgi:hypothetical protein
MPKGNEVDEFFKGLPGEQPKDADIFEEEQKNKEGAPAEGAEGEAPPTPAEGGEPRKNRRHRRLEQQLQAEREARIAAEARAAGMAERGAGASAPTDVPDKWLRIYGDTPESRTAWALQKEMFDDVAKNARDSALQEFEARQKAEKDEAARFESFIDAELEDIEDEHNVDVTSDAPAARKARREFLELVTELSPKDEHGNITAYADFGAAWKQYAARKAGKPADNSRQKELADRSMARSGGEGGAAARQPTPGFFGWKSDLNVSE